MKLDDLLSEFPNYKPSVYHVDMENNIESHFTYWDKLELQEMLIEKKKQQKKTIRIIYLINKKSTFKSSERGR